MPLYRIADFEPDYREIFGGEDIKILDLYTEGGMRVGSVADALVDQDGRFRYLVIDTRLDAVDKKILLPIGLSRINYDEKRVYVDGLSKEQVTRLPEYRENLVVDTDYEQNVRNVYRAPNNQVTSEEPDLYKLNDQDHQTFKLYETAQVSVPIQKERVVIERVTPTTADAVVDMRESQFQEGEVARIELYEETPEIRKETFVREEVRVRKVVDSNTVEAEETIRREELDIDTSGNLDVNETAPSRDQLI
jgi:uncharacterized protein (TIGR02271 family)